MGLMSYFYSKPENFNNNGKEIDNYAIVDYIIDGYNYRGNIEPVEKICCWQKFHELDFWMNELYKNKGGQNEFNGTTVNITLEDLKDLEIALNNHFVEERKQMNSILTKYPFYIAFVDYTQQAINDARVALNSGLTVFYFNN